MGSSDKNSLGQKRALASWFLAGVLGTTKDYKMIPNVEFLVENVHRSMYTTVKLKKKGLT